MQGSGLYGAAPESNRPSRGLHDRTGFEGLLNNVHLSTGERRFGVAPVRLGALRSAEIGTKFGTKSDDDLQLCSDLR